MREGRIAGLLIVVLGASGCASRSFVRNQIGSSAEVLAARIEDNARRVRDRRSEIAALETDTALQAGRLEQTTSDVESTRDDLEATQAELERTRAEWSVATETAGIALESAMLANEHADTLSRLFDARNRFEVAGIRDIYFDFDSSRLRVPDGADWERVSHLIESDPNSMIVLEGRTDSLGADDYNLILGEKRIDAVKRHLVLELGVAFYRIHSFSFGEADPRYSNTDLENREKNRAVTLVVLVPAADLETQGQN